MRKFIITAEMRDLERQVAREEISYSRMVELLNEKADRWHEQKVNELNKSFVRRCKTFIQKITYPFYFAGYILWMFITDKR